MNHKQSTTSVKAVPIMLRHRKLVIFLDAPLNL